MNQFTPQILRPLRIAALALIVFIAGLVFWSTYAPITTTLRLTGGLTSTRPSLEIQHPFGGAVAKVLISRHEHVIAGQLLMVFDTATADEVLATINDQIAQLQAENAVIRQIIEDKPIVAVGGQPDLQKYYQERADFQAIKIKAKQATITANLQSTENLANQMALVEQRIQLLQQRLEKNADLTTRGILAKTDQDSLQGQILSLYGAREDHNARVLNAASENQRNQLELQSMAAEYQLSLSEKLTSNLKNLPQLRIQALKLTEEISAAKIRAPSDGVVTTLDIFAPGMVAQRGATLLTLAQPLFQPKVTLKIPVANIDQVRIGQTGKLTLTPISQRDAPDLDAKIVSIAPEATRDRENNPDFYAAEAQMNEDDLQIARAHLGDRFHLATDMPVSLALRGRDTTFANFLFKPFIDIFSRALQDS